MTSILEVHTYPQLADPRVTDVRLAIWFLGKPILTVYHGWICLFDLVIPRKHHFWS